MNLFWVDNQNNTFLLGNLYKKDNHYYFEKNDTELLTAINHGCFGVGNIDISKKINESDKLFDFFANRIPRKDNPDIQNILRSFGLKEYDEWELLKRSHGSLLKDNYYLQ